MRESGTAKLFMHGRSQAVRLPKDFRLPGTEVRVSRVDGGVLLEPLARSPDEIDAIFTALEAYHAIAFMSDGREQPPVPDDDTSFD